jgi:hypothetical protein
MDLRCTLFPNGAWKRCCVAHDYCSADAKNDWYLRLQCDRELRNCVRRLGHYFIGDIMYLGVRFYSSLKSKVRKGAA